MLQIVSDIVSSQWSHQSCVQRAEHRAAATWWSSNGWVSVALDPAWWRAGNVTRDAWHVTRDHAQRAALGSPRARGRGGSLWSHQQQQRAAALLRGARQDPAALPGHAGGLWLADDVVTWRYAHIWLVPDRRTSGSGGGARGRRGGGWSRWRSGPPPSSSSSSFWASCEWHQEL